MSEFENAQSVDRASEWDKKLIQVESFAQTNQRWPSTTAEDHDELKLAQWWSRQKYYYKKFVKGEKSPGVNAERADRIKNLIDGFGAYERDGIWMSRFKRVKSRIFSTGKLWSYNTENAEEQKVLRWWNQQKTFYRKFRKGERCGGMTETRASCVEEIFEHLGQPVILPSNGEQADTRASTQAQTSDVTGE